MENTQTDSMINGGEPTDLEAQLAAQVDTIGENPLEDPGTGTAAASATDDAAAAAAAAAAAGATQTNDDAAAAAAAEVAAAATAAAPAPASLPAAPTPPRDFEAAYAENQRRYDEGEIDGDEYQKELRGITREEGQFIARQEIYKEQIRSVEETALADWNSVAAGWEKSNAAFMSNPIRSREMQTTLNDVVKQHPNLPAAEIFRKAEAIVFDAFGYTPPTDAAAGVDPAKAIADATAKRTPAGVPPTLASAAAAAPIEAPVNNSAYAALDGRDISSLEDAIARMSPDQLNAYLADAPGAKSTGIPG